MGDFYGNKTGVSVLTFILRNNCTVCRRQAVRFPSLGLYSRLQQECRRPNPVSTKVLHSTVMPDNPVNGIFFELVI